MESHDELIGKVAVQSVPAGLGALLARSQFRLDAADRRIAASQAERETLGASDDLRDRECCDDYDKDGQGVRARRALPWKDIGQNGSRGRQVLVHFLLCATNRYECHSSPTAMSWQSATPIRQPAA